MLCGASPGDLREIVTEKVKKGLVKLQGSKAEATSRSTVLATILGISGLVGLAFSPHADMIGVMIGNPVRGAPEQKSRVANS